MRPDPVPSCANSWFIKSLTNDKILVFTKLKAFEDNKLNIAKMMIFGFNRLENIVKKKGENAGYQHFLLFSQILFKRLFPQGFYNIGYFGKRLTLNPFPYIDTF